MALEDREAIVATIQETYILMGRAIGADEPEAWDAIRRAAVRPEAIELLLEVPVEYVTEEELLGLFREAYFGLVDNVIRVQEVLLAEHGEKFDEDLERVGLTGAGRQLKVGGFRRALDRARAFVSGRWVKTAFKWGNIILGSLGPVPVVGIAVEPIKELKEAIEAQGEEDQEGQ